MPRHTNLTPDSCGLPESVPAGRADSQFREVSYSLAKDDSYEAKMEKVRTAAQKQFGSMNGTYDSDSYVQVEGTYDDCVLYKKGGQLYKAEYEWEDGNPSFEEPKKVRYTVDEVKESAVVPLENIYAKKKKKKKNGYVLEPISAGYSGFPGPRNPASTANEP